MAFSAGVSKSVSSSKRQAWKVDRKAIHYIFVHDVDALYAEFLERQAPVMAPPKDRDYGRREFELCDLDTNKLVFGKSLR